MSMALAKANFEILVADHEVRVIALSGKWGTGKSHMWKSLRNTSQDPEMRTALYVSLFGVASINELKFKLGQAAVPLLEKRGPRADAVKGAISTAKQAAQSIFRLGSTLDELSMLAVPALVRDKFIVVDDIERKHDKLSIDEVLGFIDDFTQNYGCRILLILNTDQLIDKSVWEKFREKVIDEELRLDTLPTEAFDIAIQLSSSQFAAKIKPAVEVCKLTNIRIIRKIIRAVNKILAGHALLPDDVLDRVIPSTVLLSAIHYKGIEDGPTMAFVLELESAVGRQLNRLGRERRGEEATDEDKLHARWTILLERLGVMSTDEFEKIVSDYLEAGLVDSSAVNTVINRYLHERERAGAQVRAGKFFQCTIWDPNLTPSEILEMAKALIPDIPHLDCYMVSALHDHLVGIDGGDVVGQDMVSSWVERLNARASAPHADPRHFVLDNWNRRPLHPAIETAFAAARSRLEQPKSLLDVLLVLANNDGWGNAEEGAMQAATIDDFLKTILSLRRESLKIFLLKNLDLYANPSSYGNRFGAGPSNFLQACKRICFERAGTRWASLIEDVFKSSNLENDLRTTPLVTDSGAAG